MMLDIISAFNSKFGLYEGRHRRAGGYEHATIGRVNWKWPVVLMVIVVAIKLAIMFVVLMCAVWYCDSSA